MKKIVCIVPSLGNNNALPFIKNCLLSLRRSAADVLKLKILVVSSNSVLREKLLRFQIDNFYLVDANASFSEMNNVAIKESMQFYDSDYYLLINDDVWVEKNFFREFIKAANKSKPDLLNPLIFTPNSKYTIIDSFGVEYFTSGYAKNSIFPGANTTLATAACLFIKTPFLKKMKKRYGFYFNPLLHFYLEDVEFSIRAAGIGVKIEKSANIKVHHYGSLTSGSRSYFTIYKSYRHLLWILIMNWPFKYLARYFPNILLVQAWTIMYGTFKYSPVLYLKIIGSTLKHLSELLVYRRKILSAYDHKFDFKSILSPYSFRVGRRFWGFGIRSFLWRYL